VRELRHGRTLKQADLARRLDVTQAFVSQMERGVVELPSERVRQGLIRELGVDPYKERAGAREGKVTIAEASRIHGIDQHALIGLVHSGKINGRSQRGGLGYEIDAEQLKQELAALPPCRYEGCERPGTTASGCCGPEHGQKMWAIEARGKKLPFSVSQTIQKTKRENPKPRPDASERLVCSMHAQMLMRRRSNRKRDCLESSEPLSTYT
jgi:transcriptional regulator with XRE-family HTH domain